MIPKMPGSDLGPSLAEALKLLRSIAVSLEKMAAQPKPAPVTMCPTQRGIVTGVGYRSCDRKVGHLGAHMDPLNGAW